MPKCLVTGADGFIGSHLTELLIEKGFEVRALAQYNSFNSWGWLEELPNNNNLEVVCGDIRDAHFCQEITKNIDIVFHLAALIAIPYSYIAPDSYIDTNVTGTLNMCQASRKNGVKRFIHTSTSEVYGTSQYVPIDEKHPKQPQSPYSASKIGADAIAQSFWHAFNFPVTIVRPFNTFGPRQSSRAFIPSVISQILSGCRSIKVGDLSPTRDMNYVGDTCKGFVAIADCVNAIGKEINLSSNSEVSMGVLLEMIKVILKADIIIETDLQRIRPERSEVLRLWGDNSLLNELTGFKPEFTLEQGLKLTCEWFLKKENISKYKASIYNV